MKTRADLHAVLVELNGSSHVYWNPPETVKLIYPCVVYNLDKIQLRRANNKVYQKGHVYEGTRITSNPDDTFIEELADAVPFVNPGTPYVSDDLYHFPFTIYYG